jgi:hypothetical protein
MSHLLFLAVMADVLAKDLGDESGLDLVQHQGLRGLQISWAMRCAFLVEG